MTDRRKFLSPGPSPAEVDVNTVLTDVMARFKAAGISNDRLHMNAPVGPGCRVEPAQASMLARAFSQIVTSAIKYAHPTGLPVVFSLASAATSDGGVALEIGDDGVGFPEGFVEARDAGAGLKLVRSLVEDFGGRLQTRSDALGLTFAIQLPPT